MFFSDYYHLGAFSIVLFELNEGEVGLNDCIFICLRLVFHSGSEAVPPR